MLAFVWSTWCRIWYLCMACAEHATLLAARIVTGEAGAEAQNIARQANQRARGNEVSARSLERWFGMHRDGGWTALLPTAPQAKAPEVADDVAGVGSVS
jgi:putative transposase